MYRGLHEELSPKEFKKICNNSRGGTSGATMPIWMIGFFALVLGISILAVVMM